MLGPDQRAVQVVDPGVVRALEADRLAARLLDHGRAAMLADVVEAAQDLIAAADHDERLVVDVARKYVPGVAASYSRPTTIQSRRNHSFRSKSWIAGS